MTDRISRRVFLRRAAASGSILTVPGLLAACGGGGGGGGGGGTTAQKLAKTLHFSNWTLYMDTNKKNHTFPSLVAFQKKTGVHVAYTEDINDNASFYHKIQPLLARGESTGRDIVVLTDNDRYLGLMLEKGYAEKLDKSAIPNMKNLIAVQQHPSFDPHRDYTLPWQSGMTGIAYNDTLSDPVLSVSELLENPKLKGKVTCLNDIGDAMTLVMLANGDDPAKVTDKSWNAAFNRIKKAADNGQIRAFTGNDYAVSLANGDLSAAMSWSGDIAQIGNKHIHWNAPKDGGAIWTDNMMIPKGGDVYTASVYMNYVYDPKVQGLMEAGDPKQNITGIYYIPPVQGAAAWARKFNPPIANNPLIFPSTATLNNMHIFDNAALNNEKYQTQWNNLISA
ncbi:MAG TPA: spermidine/putrescine ABC transporter substrate-binding protein [Gaiellaceae bacterium]|jgi:spermidine/putrescine transport system substrate-binding protein|nr:spermidine/putrescine ABC transporter substrate-binding protein [Gaiellaceae bacterium]